jgi:hypothetical protein
MKRREITAGAITMKRMRSITRRHSKGTSS